MPEHDSFEILLAHDRWATGQLLEVCTSLSDDRLRRPFDLGPGSLHDTITHVLGAMRTWTDTLAARAMRPRLESDGPRTAAALRSLFDEVWGEFEAEARRRPLGEMATRTLRDGRTVRLTRAAIVTHVTTHGMHHRAQCLNMLRQLGVAPLPPSSVAEWAMAGEPRG